MRAPVAGAAPPRAKSVASAEDSAGTIAARRTRSRTARLRAGLRGPGEGAILRRPASLVYPDRMSQLRSQLHAFEEKFTEIRRESERAFEQVDAAGFRRSLDGDTNSLAVILKHVGGNLRSRFTNFLTEDGEKPWRDREGEFVDDFPGGDAGGDAGRDAAIAAWNAGWDVLGTTLASLSDDDLGRTVTIRGVPHSVFAALARSLSHMSYHQGQIVLVARILVGPKAWKSISIPRGGTAARHAEMGFDPHATREA